MAFCASLPFLTHQRQLNSLRSHNVKLQIANNAPRYVSRFDQLGVTQLWDHVVGVQAVGEQADNQLLENLNTQPRLQYLSLQNSLITPDKLKQFLETHPKLVVLESIGNPRLNREAIQELEAEFPTISIIWRGTAFLGVQYRAAFNKGLELEVAPNGPAARGGMLDYDNLIEFDGTPVTQFDQLISLIGHREPGEAVGVKVLRRGRPVNLTIELGEWGVP